MKVVDFLRTLDEELNGSIQERIGSVKLIEGRIEISDNVLKIAQMDNWKKHGIMGPSVLVVFGILLRDSLFFLINI